MLNIQYSCNFNKYGHNIRTNISNYTKSNPEITIEINQINLIVYYYKDPWRNVVDICFVDNNC